MMNGTYKVSISTPMGQQSGIVNFIDNNGALSGSIRAMGNENPFSNGKMSGNAFEFDGSLKTGFGKIEYNAKGTIVGDKINANVKTKFGMLQISGSRV